MRHFKMNFLVLILSVLYFAASSTAVKASFIDPCEWHDKACIMASAEKAKPYIAVGLPELGVPSFDPLPIDRVESKEGEFDMTFMNMMIRGVSKCNLVNIERKKKGSVLVFEVECPITVDGDYIAGGKVLLVPIEGNGKFSAQTENIYIHGKVKLNPVEGSDGKLYWKVDNLQHTFDPKEKFVIKLENLFQGNEAKAKPIEKIMDEDWKEVITTVGRPLVDAIITKIVDGVAKFFEAVPVDELEKQ